MKENVRSVEIKEMALNIVEFPKLILFFYDVAGSVFWGKS